MSVRQIPAREFSRGRRTILLLRSGASADRRKLVRLFSDGGALPRRRYVHVIPLHLVRDAAEGDGGPVLKFKRRFHLLLYLDGS